MRYDQSRQTSPSKKISLSLMMTNPHHNQTNAMYAKIHH